jgi:hypothetical protein
LFRGAGLEPCVQPVRWCQPLPDQRCGVYVVSLSVSSTDKYDCLLRNAPIDVGKVQAWIENVPRLRLDLLPPTPEKLTERLSRFWLPDESILYIGKAGPSASRHLSKRVDEYYSTPLGDSGPHAGGRWIQTLLPSVLENLRVYWAATSDPVGAEDALMRTFIHNVSIQTRESLHDPNHPFPFANLEYRTGGRRCIKNHGIKYPVNKRTPKK